MSKFHDVQWSSINNVSATNNKRCFRVLHICFHYYSYYHLKYMCCVYRLDWALTSCKSTCQAISTCMWLPSNWQWQTDRIDRFAFRTSAENEVGVTVTSLHPTVPTARYLIFLARTMCHHQMPALPSITLLERVLCSGLMADIGRAVLHQESSCTLTKQQRSRIRHEKSTSETQRHQDMIKTPDNPN